MASRFIELNEAAKMLGLTPDQLIEKRSNGDIHGYRDGASWKFKEEEVQRFKDEMSSPSQDDDLIPFDGLDDLQAPDGDEGPVLVSGEEGRNTPSTIIGGTAENVPTESDLRLSDGSELMIKPDASGTDLTLVAADSELDIDDDGSAISLDAPPKKLGSVVDSDVALVPGVGNDTDVRLVPDTGSDKRVGGSAGIAADVLGDSEMNLKSTGAGGTGPLSGARPGSSKGPGSTGLGTGDLDIALDSELALSDDDEMVLGGSGIGSDLTLNPAESGINLSSPTDSGLSLEADSGISLQTPTDSGLSLEDEPLDMAGSSISALELPEDESIELDSAEPGQNLKKDEDFLLTPSDEMFADESDSGSQVIALEDSAAFDQDPNALAQAALVAEPGGLDQQLDALGGAGLAPTTVVTPARMGPAVAQEAPYSVWNILGLLSILLFLSVSGILLSDIVRNMWAWDQGLDVSTSISRGLSAAFGLK